MVAFRCPCLGSRYFQIPVLKEILPHWMPNDFVDTLACFLFICGVKTIFIIATKHVLEHFNLNFAAIKPPHKKWYVLNHFSKVLLLLYIILCSNHVLDMYRMYSDSFPSFGKRRAAIFVANNVVALYMPQKISRSTAIHHLAAVIILILVMLHDLQEKGWTGTLGIAKMSCFYGMFLSCTFGVQAYLGLQVLYPKAVWLKGFVRLTLWIGWVCFVLNCCMHGLWIASLVSSGQVSLSTFLYMILLVIAVYDDVVLLRWLNKQCKNN